MSNTITVRKNWKKKILALTVGNPEVAVYSLSNGFTADTFRFKNLGVNSLTAWVTKELDTFRGSYLRYDKDTGRCVIHCHSNLWYEWTQKIDW